MERQLISSAAVASQTRRSTETSLPPFAAGGASCEPLVSATTPDWPKLERSPDKLGRRSLDSVVITSLAKGLSPSRDYHFSVPNERQGISPAIAPSCSNPEVDSEQNVGGFHFSAPQPLDVKDAMESDTSDASPCSESHGNYKKVEPGSSCVLPKDPTGQSFPLLAVMSPNLLEQISMEILERKKTENQDGIDDDFLLRCTKEGKKCRSPLPRKIRGSHSRRSSSYRLALQPSASDPVLSVHADGDLFCDSPSVPVGGGTTVETQQKNDGKLLPAVTSALLPRRRRSTMADDVDAPTNHAEVHAMPAFDSRRDLGKPTQKMTGSSSSAIGYVKSQVKKISDQFFQSPVSVRGARLL